MAIRFFEALILLQLLFFVPVVPHFLPQLHPHLHTHFHQHPHSHFFDARFGVAAEFKGGNTGDLESFLSGYKTQHPTTEDSPTIEKGNDGGMVGDVGLNYDQMDTKWGKDESTKVDPVDVRTVEMHKDDLTTNFLGAWELVSPSSGVSAMHMQLMTNNKVLIFDSTVLGPSAIKLDGKKPCPIRPPAKNPDCWAHAVIYDVETAKLRTLYINTDPWCSSGGLGIDGTMVSTGGYLVGAKSVRFIKPCDTCDWEDTPDVLGSGRWYSTQVKLEDGGFVVFGGRQSFSFEFVPVTGKPNKVSVNMPFLRETSDLDENNLYPFVHLLPDGNLFVFANSRSILFNAKANKIIREYPRLHGGSRNYPASGSSALLPLKLDGNTNVLTNKPEVLICGGAKPKAYRAAGKNKTYMPALQDCAMLKVMEPNACWQVEQMPSRRVMGDLLILPTGEILILNGAQRGTSAWQYAKDPNFIPVLFDPYKPDGQRFRNLQPTTIPRMYHSTAIVLPDGRVLVGGSNTNPTYLFTNVEFPTELRMEKFSPHYLDPALKPSRPVILPAPATDPKMAYGANFNIKFTIPALKAQPQLDDLKVNIYAPPFTTHGWSMGQRLIQLGIVELKYDPTGVHVTAKAPPGGTIAPPGFYLVFAVYRGVPSVGIWVQLT